MRDFFGVDGGFGSSIAVVKGVISFSSSTTLFNALTLKFIADSLQEAPGDRNFRL